MNGIVIGGPHVIRPSSQASHWHSDLFDIREGDYYYVDKTPFIERLANQNKYYFLSRPRRFGKSLLLDTLRCLFEGRQALISTSLRYSADLSILC
ncbi:AAA family ATPase [Halomonas sp. 18071143]|uniref:AAA family ATPase n=1 Tax=Halomonas sp. 18071143 TaxID=2855441 RepID=UPI0020CB58F7|nr:MULTISPECIES: AAA family ATPase [unclassified Halomonas]